MINSKNLEIYTLNKNGVNTTTVKGLEDNCKRLIQKYKAEPTGENMQLALIAYNQIYYYTGAKLSFSFQLYLMLL